MSVKRLAKTIATNSESIVGMPQLPLPSGVKSVSTMESGIHQYAKWSHERNTSSRIL